MFGKIFDPQNTFWHWVGKVPAFLGLSLLWAVLCLPVITIVPSTIALFDAVTRNIRGDQPGIFSRFFHTFRNEFKRGIVLSLIWLVIAAIFGFGFIYLDAASRIDTSLENVLSGYTVLMVIPTAIFVWMVALESRFVYSLGQLLKNALMFALGYLKETLLIIIFFSVCIIACVFYIPLIFFIPATMMLLISFPVESVFKTLTNEAEEDVEAIEEAE